MLIKTSGIVIHSLKYSDNSNIVTIYTTQFGRTTYMVHAVNKKKSKFRAAFLQPLSIVEMNVYHQPNKNIQTIKDVNIVYPFTGIPYNPVKNLLALFIAEVLYRALKTSEPDDELFNFIQNSIQALDCCEDGLANFHLVFMMKLCLYLGFSPNREGNNLKYFDLENGVFVAEKPLHKHYLDEELTFYFLKILHTDYIEMKNIILNRNIRLKLIESLIDYYKLHIPDFKGLKSLAVLHELFD